MSSEINYEPIEVLTTRWDDLRGFELLQQLEGEIKVIYYLMSAVVEMARASQATLKIKKRKRLTILVKNIR